MGGGRDEKEAELTSVFHATTPRTAHQKGQGPRKREPLPVAALAWLMLFSPYAPMVKDLGFSDLLSPRHVPVQVNMFDLRQGGLQPVFCAGQPVRFHTISVKPKPQSATLFGMRLHVVL